ncbi:MAG: hypothetical protein M1607_02840 [Patescibacteria group bacterium]|nr:hypothetical protein [Patescibacteria group bacterium]
MSEDNKHGEVPRQAHIREIQAIEESRNAMILTRSRIKDLVEPPLVKACEKMWDLNIRSLSSSANSKDIDYGAYIIIDFDSLSEENKILARNEGEFIEDYDGKPAVKITMPISTSTTLEEVESHYLSLVEQFKKQEAVWIPRFTLEDLKRLYAIKPEDQRYGMNDFVKEGYYYDPEEKKFYLSEEHYLKFKDKPRNH